MTPSQYQATAVVLAMVALFGGVTLAKRGSTLLTEKEATQLRDMGPDPIAQLAQMVMAGAAYLSRQYLWVMVPIVVLAAIAAMWRVPYRQWKMPWPLTARRYLAGGNVVLTGGVAIACVFYMSQFL